METGSSFDLTGKDLLSLQDARVQASVTDLIVALSYPDRFIVERSTRADYGQMGPLLDDPFFLGWSFGFPMWTDAFGFYSPMYGPHYWQFYSPFYSYLGWYDQGYYGGGGSYVVIGDGAGGGGGGDGSIQPTGRGRSLTDSVTLAFARVRRSQHQPVRSREHHFHDRIGCRTFVSWRR